MAPYDDDELIRRARQGDDNAFEQLVFRYDRHVLSVASRYVSNAEDAKDIYQEVFLKVYRGLPRFRFQCEFTTWLFRITTNVCLTHRSRGARRIRVPFGNPAEEPGEEPEPISPDRLPDESASDAEIALNVAQALESLSPQQRMVFTLRHFQGYKLREIARIMECAEGTVKRYLFAATRRMREHLKDRY